jgi:hypothetical protein
MTYLALGRGRPRFRQGFSCPALLEKTNIKLAILGIRGYHALWRTFPGPSTRIANFLLYIDLKQDLLAIHNPLINQSPVNG